MKKILILLLLFGTNYGFAGVLDEQEIKTENQKCAIHYLTPKQKNLWSIEVDENYCSKGWVQGFATVVLKDALSRTARTLKGFFYQGYWLSDYPGEISSFNRLSLKENTQDFIFPVFFDEDLKITYYMVTRASQQNGIYKEFEFCPSTPLLVATHQPVSDFKQSLFQAHLLKEAKKYIHQKCPQARSVSIIGMQEMTENAPPIFQADINITTDETTLTYHTMTEKKDVPHPTELRHEQAEPLLTIHPSKDVVAKTDTFSLSTELIQSGTTTPPKNTRQSAVDIALLAHVLQNQIKAKTIVYVNAPQKDYSFEVTHPLPLTIQTTEVLAPGWYIITGLFQPQEDKTLVQVETAQKCKKEWCANEM